jgi:TRAF3-interacting protein 1
MEAKLPLDMDQMVAPERGKSRGGTRGGKPNQATPDTGLGGFGSATPKLDAEIEKCDGTEATTQALLGPLIARPKLTEKLLSKPPFRFLHDIVMEVIRITGFAKGLYNEIESDSANISDKEQKIRFLEKIIKVVGVQLNTLVEAKPSRIVAGLDAQNTNNFLQLLAVAIKHMPDSTNAVRTVLEEFGEIAPSQHSAPAESAPAQRAETKEPSQSRFEAPQLVEDTKADERKQAARQSQPASIQSEPKDNSMSARQDDRREFVPDDKVSLVEGILILYIF